MCKNDFSQACFAYLLHTLGELINSDDAIFVWDGAEAGWHGNQEPCVQSHRTFITLHQRSVNNRLYLIFKDITGPGFTFKGADASPVTVCL